MSTTRVVREDGTVEEVVEGGDGIISRIGKKLLNFISNFLESITGGGGIRLNILDRLRNNRARSEQPIASELDKERYKITLDGSQLN